MAGVAINAVVNDADVIAAFNRLLKSGQNLGPALADIGEDLSNSHDDRFDLEVSPEGGAWADLSQTTLDLKTKNTDKILTESSELRDSLHYQIEGDAILFGTNKIYAAMQHFGGTTPWGDIPARPFIGLSAGDRNRAVEVLSDHLNNAIS